jgi:hypothetical protein
MIGPLCDLKFLAHFKATGELLSKKGNSCTKFT